ncbi:NAD-binding protein [Brachybacterium endophyticum]|nr:NAD-binding protein [Brachybacterium endophyticum]
MAHDGHHHAKIDARIHGADAIVVGRGYIGSELAAALVQNGAEVGLCYPQ